MADEIQNGSIATPIKQVQKIYLIVMMKIKLFRKVSNIDPFTNPIACRIIIKALIYFSVLNYIPPFDNIRIWHCYPFARSCRLGRKHCCGAEKHTYG